MHKWTDADGRDWLLAINVATARAVRDLVGFDLTQVLERKDALLELLGDDFRLVDVLYVLHAGQVAERFAGLDEAGRQNAFAASLAGDAIEAASEAFLKALCDFFPSRRRKLLTAALTKVTQTQAALLDRAQAKIDSEQMTAAIQRIVTQADAEMDQSIAAIGGGPSNS